MQQNIMETITLKSSLEYLSNALPNVPISNYLNEEIEEWVKDSLEDTVCNLKLNLKTIFEELLGFSKRENDSNRLKIAFQCVAFNLLHESLMSIIYDRFGDKDDYIFEKCKLLHSMNVTAEQFGGNKKFAVHLTAALVELASLDNHKSPIEKINCLCSTYDYIFAELKTVLIGVIAKYSEKENEIPVINNGDIIPVLMVVLVRSKPAHFLSNIYYMETFMYPANEDSHIQRILDCFKIAIEELQNVTEQTLMPGCEEVCRDLDLIKVIQITSNERQVKEKDEDSLSLNEEMERITNLIIDATNENHSSK